MLARLKKRLPDATDDALLTELLNGAGEAICAFTARGSVPAALQGAQVELAVVYYNRMGMEGETAHAEGKVSHTATDDLPASVRRQLAPWRLAKGVS